MITEPLNGSLRNELIRALVRETEKTRRVEVQKGQDMTNGILCPDCWTEADLIAEATNQPTARRVSVEYFRSGMYSVWVGRCVPCDLLLYVMRKDVLGA